MGEDGEESDRNSAHSLSWRSAYGRNSAPSKGTEEDLYTMHTEGAPSRRGRRDMSSDLSAFISSQTMLSRHDASNEKHGRVMEWLDDAEMQMSSCSPPRSLIGSQDKSVPNFAAKSLSRSRTSRRSTSGSLNPRSSTDHPSLHRRSPSAVCKLPCQACGNAHESAPSLEAPVVMYNKNDRLSKSARHLALANDGKKELSSLPQQAPVAIYNRNDRLSKSARHLVLADDGKKELPPLVRLPAETYTKFDRCSISSRHSKMAAPAIIGGHEPKMHLNFANFGQKVPAHARSASVSKSGTKPSKPAAEDSAFFLDRRENVPRTINSSSTREQGITVKSKHGSSAAFGFQIKSPATTVHQWFSQLLLKGSKVGSKVNPLMEGCMLYFQTKNRDSMVVAEKSASQYHGNQFIAESCNSIHNVRGEAEQVIVKPTLSDVLNEREVVCNGGNVLSKSSGKGNFRGLHLHKSRSVHSGRGMHYNLAVQHTTHDERLLSPPKNRIKISDISVSTYLSSQVARELELLQSNLKQDEDEAVGSKNHHEVEQLNEFLRKQRKHIDQQKASYLQIMFILTSEASSSISSMVCAICYAWLLEYTTPTNCTHVPVINMPRKNMWKNEQAAWLFHHTGLDAKALLFCDEVDMDRVAYNGNYKMMLLGREVLKTNGEVASCCTLLVEKYSQAAQSMLKGGILKKLLLAGLLLDTENLDFSKVFCTARDEAAAALLLNGTESNSHYGFYLQLKRQYYDRAFGSILRETYGEPYVNAANMDEREKSGKERNGDSSNSGPLTPPFSSTTTARTSSLSDGSTTLSPDGGQMIPYESNHTGSSGRSGGGWRGGSVSRFLGIGFRRSRKPIYH